MLEQRVAEDDIEGTVRERKPPGVPAHPSRWHTPRGRAAGDMVRLGGVAAPEIEQAVIEVDADDLSPALRPRQRLGARPARHIEHARMRVSREQRAQVAPLRGQQGARGAETAGLLGEPEEGFVVPRGAQDLRRARFRSARGG